MPLFSLCEHPEVMCKRSARPNSESYVVQCAYDMWFLHTICGYQAFKAVQQMNARIQQNDRP